MSRGWSATGAPLEVEGESGAKAGRRARVGAVLRAVPAGPAVAAPSDLLEEATDGGAVEALKILAKRDPRSNTATFMSQPWKCCPRCCWNLKTTGSRASGVHPPLLLAIRRRRRQTAAGGLGSQYAAEPGGLRCAPHAEKRLPGSAPHAGDDLPDAQVTRRAPRLRGHDHPVSAAVPLPWCCETPEPGCRGCPPTAGRGWGLGPRRRHPTAPGTARRLLS